MNCAKIWCNDVKQPSFRVMAWLIASFSPVLAIRGMNNCRPADDDAGGDLSCPYRSPGPLHCRHLMSIPSFLCPPDAAAKQTMQHTQMLCLLPYHVLPVNI